MTTFLPIFFAVAFYLFTGLVGCAALAALQPHKNIGRIELFALSPAVGLSVLTLLTTYLAKSNITLDKISGILAIALALLSVFVILTRRAALKKPIDNWWYLAPLAVTTALLAIPFIVGGYQFTILRGNGSDGFNYASMANSLLHYKLSWIASEEHAVLASYSPSLPFSQYLLHGRWSSSALLAFASSIAGISPIELEYSFMLAMMLTLFSSLLAALSSMGYLNRFTAWIAAAFVVGFWGQFLVDIAALSQIIALPIVVALIAWILSPLDEDLLRYGAPVTAILLVALLFNYLEIVIPYLPGTAILFAIRARASYKAASSLRALWKPVLLLSLATIVLAAPLVRFMIDFAHAQVNFVAFSGSTAATWEQAFFSWMGNPIRGVWGGGPKLVTSTWVDPVFVWLAYGLGYVLTAGILVAIVQVLRSRQLVGKCFSEAGALLLILTGLVGALLLIKMNNPWSAGKAMSYFVVLIPLVLSGWVSINRSGMPFRRIWTGVAVGWVLMNGMFAGARISHAANETDFSPYVVSHGYYRLVNAEQIAQIRYFGCAKGSRVAVFDLLDWAREYRLDVAEGRGYTTTMYPYTQTRDDDIRMDTRVPPSFDCVFAPSDYFDANDVDRSISDRQIFARTNGERFVALAGMGGGYGLEIESTTIKPYILTGKQDITITVVGRAEDYELNLRACAVAFPESGPVSVSIDYDGKQLDVFQTTGCMQRAIKIHGNREGFRQTIRIVSTDTRSGPTHVIGDPRDLRLRIDPVSVRLID